MLNEADTRAKLINPKLYESCWAEERVVRDRTIASSRLSTSRETAKKWPVDANKWVGF